MMNFSTLQGLTIPEGVVTQIAKDGVVLWSAENYPEGAIVLKVEKVTSDTYAGETTYTGEEFILLDIYPKTNGTVNVTYGGLTKTITDTSGVEEPNAQQVFFGTFNGVSDSVTTPASGELTIEGDCVGVGIGSYSKSNKASSIKFASCITAIGSLGNVEFVPDTAFISCNKILEVVIPNSVKSIGERAFFNLYNLESDIKIPNGVISIGDRAFGSCALSSVKIPASVEHIGVNPWVPASGAYTLTSVSSIEVDSGNNAYKVDGNCLMEIASNKLVFGCKKAVIPSYTKIIGDYAFESNIHVEEVVIPSSVGSIGPNAFLGNASLRNFTLLASTPPTLDDSNSFNSGVTITVPNGCGETYKSAVKWSDFADQIVEAS